MFPSKFVINSAETAAYMPNYKFRLGAVIYDKKGGFAYGWNMPNKTHPKAETPYHTIHAEFSALYRAIRQGLKPRGMSLYVHRVLKNDTPGLAKPCEACRKMLAWAGVWDVYYSTESGIQKL